MTVTENQPTLKDGRVVAIAGPVIDVEFPPDAVPQIMSDVAGWITSSGDSRGLPFAIIDKNTAQIIVYNSDGKALGRALHRPSLLPAPALALRLMLGEMADSLLLGGQRVLPARATDLGFSFRYSVIDEAFANLLA